MKKNNGGKKASKLFIEILEEIGVQHAFGNPGTTELPLINAIEQSEINYIMTLHEDIAVGAASGYSTTMRYHSQKNPEKTPLTLVNLHTTPGVAHGIGNLHGAWYTGAPIILTSGSQAPIHEKREPTLSGDRCHFVEKYTKWSTSITHPDQIPETTRKAARTALTPPTGPVYIDIPWNIQKQKTDRKPIPTGDIPKPGNPDNKKINQAAKITSQSKEPVIITGDQVARTNKKTVELVGKLAENIGARVHGEVMMSEKSYPPNQKHCVSILPTKASQIKKLLNVDTVIQIGCTTNVPFYDYQPPLIPENTRTIEIGDNPQELGKNYHADITINGNIEKTLRKLVEKTENQFTQEQLKKRLEKTHKTKRKLEKKREKQNPPDPDKNRPTKLEVVRQLKNQIKNQVVVDEGVTAGFLLRCELPLNHSQLLGIKSGGLGYGLPAAVGAAIAEQTTKENRKVIAYIGDGSYMYYPQTLYTAQRYLKKGITVIVINNQGYKILRDAKILEQEGTKPLHITQHNNITKNAESHDATTQKNKDKDKLPRQLKKAIETNENHLLEIEVYDP
ncbi:thiamine pyrophosphate-binding protein [Methanonatronarchaeum sp. AMET6-2]|uniref:thiamine pyrophosphate-binding protein n=1 Tax=Methanonatronarchaeum sp. AMET6-2 TaxID=2933293 RepID=UPI00120040C9|nr:thiamine pyrophosphate-binding protein [Methanonatronarchaeum sp. AMET6-2]RZN62701.1 MAG: thiamine pyrophosphate-binding protein [Methanonatronarchaeia archaeon]UOY09945.1 thiamine pyrophosphate-binding protein [Methanonatronarchaeum sp. AMET6-2]